MVCTQPPRAWLKELTCLSGEEKVPNAEEAPPMAAAGTWRHGPSGQKGGWAGALEETGRMVRGAWQPGR